MSNAIMTYETDQGEVKLSPSIVKRYLVSGQADRVTDQEVVMFMQMCKYQGLNPFLREAYLIKFGNAPATMVTGKDTFTKRAAKSPLCAGYEAGVVVQGKDGQLHERKGALVLPNETLVGGWAKVYRKDWKVPMAITVGLDEYARRKNNGELMSNWKQMPGTMIRKVALVQALREAIPEEFSGLYSPEEMPVDDSELDEEPITVEFEEVEDDGKITKDQAKALFELGDQDTVIECLKTLGYEGSTEIKIDEYDNVVKYIKETVETKNIQEEVEETDPVEDEGLETPLPWDEVEEVPFNTKEVEE
jgi:phage recombination protein Bet